MIRQSPHPRAFGSGPRPGAPALLTELVTHVTLIFRFDTQIAVNFRTGYLDEGHFVDDWRLAAKSYGFSFGFILDSLGSFPLNLVLLAFDNTLETAVGSSLDAGGDADAGRLNRIFRLARMAKLLKLTRMVKLYKYMSNFEECVRAVGTRLGPS